MTHRNNFGSACISLWICQGREGSEELSLSKSSQLVCITRTKWLTSGSLVRPRLWHYRGYIWSKMSREPQGESCFLTLSNSPPCSWWGRFIAQTSSKFWKAARAQHWGPDKLRQMFWTWGWRGCGFARPATWRLSEHPPSSDTRMTQTMA